MFFALTVLTYAVLAGVAQSLTVVALKVWHQEIGSGARTIQVLPPLMLGSLACFVVAGWALARVMPLQGGEIRYTLVTLGLICSLVPVAKIPYGLGPIAAVRCGLALLTCTLMFTGARQPILPAARRRNAPE